ncbi:MAG TPA: hypothetical protein VG710_08735 [Opitutus sp.]|nr:hypothetical protein [Opitutus sp.]
MRFRYIITGTNERYAAMAAISVVSLRTVHPHARIELHVWPEPGDTRIWRLLRAQSTRVSVEDVPDGMDARGASRWLKTTLRQRVDGPFVFLDGDTLVVRPLDAIGEVAEAGQLGAVRDRNRAAPRPGWPHWTGTLYRGCGWPAPPRNYLNSGVVAWPDTDAARALSADWHLRWKLSRQRGVNLDQPAFNAAIDARPPHEIAVLPDRFNALIDADPRLAAGAHVLHFFAGVKAPKPMTIFDSLVTRLLQRGEFDDGLWEKARDGGWPYLVPPPARWRLGADYGIRSARQWAGDISRYAVHRLRRIKAG